MPARTKEWMVIVLVSFAVIIGVTLLIERVVKTLNSDNTNNTERKFGALKPGLETEYSNITFKRITGNAGTGSYTCALYNKYTQYESLLHKYKTQKDSIVTSSDFESRISKAMLDIARQGSDSAYAFMLKGGIPACNSAEHGLIPALDKVMGMIERWMLEKERFPEKNTLKYDKSVFQETYKRAFKQEISSSLEKLKTQPQNKEIKDNLELSLWLALNQWNFTLEDVGVSEPVLTELNVVIK